MSELFDTKVELQKVIGSNVGQSRIVTELTRTLFRYMPTKAQKTNSASYNFWRYKAMPALDRLMPTNCRKSRYIDAATDAKIMSRFKESNEALDEVIGFSLKPYGYLN